MVFIVRHCLDQYIFKNKHTLKSLLLFFFSQLLLKYLFSSLLKKMGNSNANFFRLMFVVLEWSSQSLLVFPVLCIFFLFHVSYDTLNLPIFSFLNLLFHKFELLVAFFFGNKRGNLWIE